MNKREFKQCMKQGLGRCAVALSSSDSIEKYKDIVLYGCLHNLSYDTQCEGTRAEYVYRLTRYFHDDDYFLLPSIEAFEELPNSSDWLFAHFVDLLQKFAENGNERARKALQAKYEQLLFCLLKKHRFSSYDFARDNFERISLSLIYIGDYDEFLDDNRDVPYKSAEIPVAQDIQDEVNLQESFRFMPVLVFVCVVTRMKNLNWQN